MGIHLPVIGATVETGQSKYHEGREKRARTPGQMQKFLRRGRFARQTNAPVTYGDIAEQEAESHYREAADKAISSPRRSSGRAAEGGGSNGDRVGKQRRDGHYKYRCVYNGR